MTPRPHETPEQIASRYGATVHRGCEIIVCPPCTFTEQNEPPTGPWARENAGTKKRVTARREKVRGLADGTRTRHEIAEILGEPIHNVDRDLKALRSAGEIVQVLHTARLREDSHEPRFKERGR